VNRRKIENIFPTKHAGVERNRKPNSHGEYHEAPEAHLDENPSFPIQSTPLNEQVRKQTDHFGPHAHERMDARRARKQVDVQIKRGERVAPLA
jgi:hypothetical protein